MQYINQVVGVFFLGNVNYEIKLRKLECQFIEGKELIIM